MADIINKINGRTFRQVDNTLAEILVDLGLVEYFRAATVAGSVSAPQAPRPKENTFSIGRTQWGKLSIVLTTPSGNVTYFGGEPAQARTAFQMLAWSGAAQAQVLTGPEVPEHVIKEYRAQYAYEQAVKAATAEKIAGK